MDKIIPEPRASRPAVLLLLAMSVLGLRPLSDLRHDEDAMADVSARGMVGAIVVIFVIAILGAAFTKPLQDQVDSWKQNLTTEGQATAAAVVGLIPLLFWVLLAVGVILLVVEMFLGSGREGI